MMKVQVHQEVVLTDLEDNKKVENFDKIESKEETLNCKCFSPLTWICFRSRKNATICLVTTAVILAGVILVILWSVGVLFTGSVNVRYTKAFDNLSVRRLTSYNGSAIGTYLTPTYFGIKVSQVGMGTFSPGQNQNGEFDVVWINPDCHYQGQSNSCPQSKITDYMDMSQSQEDIDAELNSQNRPIKSSTSFKTLEIFYDNDEASNPLVGVAFQAGDMEAVQECSLYFESGETAIDLNLKAGASIKVELTYNLTNIIQIQNEDISDVGQTCCGAGVSGSYFCLYSQQYQAFFIPSLV